MAVVTLPPNQTASGPQVTAPEAADAVSAAAKDTSATKVTRQRTTTWRGDRPPLAPASVFAPDGRRRLWHFTYPCRVCGAHNFGRSHSLADVTGLRRATCGHLVSVMIARVYGQADGAAA